MRLVPSESIVVPRLSGLRELAQAAGRAAGAYQTASAQAADNAAGAYQTASVQAADNADGVYQAAPAQTASAQAADNAAPAQAAAQAAGLNILRILREKGLSIPLSSQTWSAFASDTRSRLYAGWEGEYAALSFSVDERHIRAVNRRDNAPVYQDSCVEFFASPEGRPYYYNFEFNALGYLLAAVGPDRFEREDVPAEKRASILRFSSLDEAAFETEDAEFKKAASEKAKTKGADFQHWDLTVVLPVSVFFRDSFTGFSGLRLRGNFYKCGDLLPQPHYQSWSPVKTPEPDFHRPEFFGNILFGESETVI